MIDTSIKTLSLITILGGLYFIIALLAILLANKNKSFLNIKSWIAKNSLKLSFVVSLTATLGSLFLSEVAHFTPCILCWFQRIFMYPLALMFGMGLIRKDKSIIPYGLMLSVIGALIAGYHYLLQINPNMLAPCEAVGYSAPCTERFVTHFGYVTIPMTSLTAFLIIAVTLATTLKKNK